MNEQEYKKLVMGILRAKGWKMQEHEDAYRNFIPDVSFGALGVDGWIEFKYTPHPHKTLGCIRHYTKGQENWLIERGLSGSGHCYLWIGGEHEHYILKWDVLRRARSMPWSDLSHVCLVCASSPQDMCDQAHRMLRVVATRRGR